MWLQLKKPLRQDLAPTPPPASLGQRHLGHIQKLINTHWKKWKSVAPSLLSVSGYLSELEDDFQTPLALSTASGWT